MLNSRGLFCQPYSVYRKLHAYHDNRLWFLKYQQNTQDWNRDLATAKLRVNYFHACQVLPILPHPFVRIPEITKVFIMRCCKLNAVSKHMLSASLLTQLSVQWETYHFSKLQLPVQVWCLPWTHVTELLASVLPGGYTLSPGIQLLVQAMT